ncbi:MAG: hypothetical protein QM680_12025 [Luteolibacter sp.]
MKTRIAYWGIGLLVAAGWLAFAFAGWEIHSLNSQITALEAKGDPEEQVDGLQELRQTWEERRTFNGLLLVIFTATAAGIFVVKEVLPFVANRAVDSLYGSGEEWDVPKASRAVVLVAQGKFPEAIGELRKQIEAEPENPLPWLEVAKIQRVNLDDASAAARTLKGALDAHAWPEDEFARVSFRLAEIYHQDLGDPYEARSILQRVIADFPESGHAEKSRQLLTEWKNA